MRSEFKIAFAVVFFVLCVVFVFAYTSGFLGKVIQWNTQQSGEDYFSRGLPELSPDTLPENRTLDTSNAIPEACNNAREQRDDICGKFIAEYPSGCHWWHFKFISSCNERYDLCKKLQQDVLRECKIA